MNRSGFSDTQRGEGIGGDGQVWGSVTHREGRGQGEMDRSGGQ